LQGQACSLRLCDLAGLLRRCTPCLLAAVLVIAGLVAKHVPVSVETYHLGEATAWLDPQACFADGPHFDMTYYITYSSIVGSIFGLIGIGIFQSTMREWYFRPLFWVTTVLKCLAAMVRHDNHGTWFLQPPLCLLTGLR
jgi:hypothetical protein